MNWKLFFARDSKLWVVLFYGGFICVALSMAPQAVLDTFPAWLGPMMPTLRLIAFVALAVGGKMGLSFADKKSDLS